MHTQATHVDALSDMFSDAGSTPAASTNAILPEPPFGFHSSEGGSHFAQRFGLTRGRHRLY